VGSEINRRMMIRIRIRIIMALPVIDELNSRVLLACLLACLPACLPACVRPDRRPRLCLSFPDFVSR